MKLINNYNKDYIKYLNKLKRPYSVHENHPRKYISINNPFNNDNSYSFYNNISNNYEQVNKKIIELKHNEIINEVEELNNKQKYENLNVKIFNLYNLKEKSEPLSIKINNNSPKYYINNCVNQVLLKNIITRNKRNNEEKNVNEKINNNIKNNKYIFTLFSPRYEGNKYRKINFGTENKNIINIKKSNNLQNMNKIINGKENKGVGPKNPRKNKILNKYDYNTFNNINEYNLKNIIKNDISFQDKNRDIINKTNIEKNDKYSYCLGNKTSKNIGVKNHINKNQNNFYKEKINSKLTLDALNRFSYKEISSKKSKDINNNNLIQLLNLEVDKNNNNNKYLFSENKQKINKNRAIKSIFDLKNNKFESKTLNKIIKEFNDNELEKIDLIENKTIQNKISLQKMKNKKVIKNNENIKVPKNIKKIPNNDCEIYLQYNLGGDVEKILLNDKNGNISSFIPSKI